MKIFKLTAMLAAAAFFSGAATASTVSFTEGQRAQVAGSTVIVPRDAAGSRPGFDLGAVGSSTEVHGRIVESNDFYTFSSGRVFSVNWIFGGFDLEAGGTVADSGLTAVPFDETGGPVDIFLTDLSTDTVVASVFGLVTNIISGTENIFGTSFAAGNYELSLHGQGGPLDDALYDITISAVPLPAGFLLMGSALGGLVLVRRRKQKTA